MNLARQLLNHTQGFDFLTTPEEKQEAAVVDIRRTKLQYLKGSAQKGLRLWNVIAPQLPGYKYGPDSGFPTFGLNMLRQKGLLK
jgi:hypothetical protein